MPPYSIRRVRPDDDVLVRDVRLRALATDPLSFGSTHAREVAFGAAVWRERCLEQSAGDDAATWLALDERPIEMGVGMVVVRRDRERAHVFGVYGMWVAPEARGAGVGRALLETALAWIRGRGTRVELSVTDRAASARRLYTRLGFAPTGRTTPSSHAADVVEHALALAL